MFRSIRAWRQSRRYRAAVRKLLSATPGELKALGISPEQVPHLAFEMTRLTHPGVSTRWSGLS